MHKFFKFYIVSLGVRNIQEVHKNYLSILIFLPTLVKIKMSHYLMLVSGPDQTCNISVYILGFCEC